MVQEESLDAALMQNNLLETRQADWHIRYAGGPSYDAIFARIPHAHLNHVICFLPGSICETKTVEDFETANLKSICLSSIDLSSSLVHNSSIDATSSHPSSEHHAGRPGSDNENVAF
jgi:hypothetical protein